MAHSLLVLSKLRVKGGLRKLKRTLLTPKGIIPAIFLLGFLSMMLMPMIVARMAPDEVRNRFDFNRFLHPAMLAGLWLLTMAGGKVKSPIAFTLAEVEFLFPGPYTRRQLLVYKLAIDALSALGFVVFVPLFAGAYLTVWWPAALWGLWLTMAFVQMLSVIVALGLDLVGARLGRWLVVVVPALAFATALSLWQAGVLDEGIGWPERLQALDASWIARIFLAPFVVFHNAILAMTLSEAAIWSGAGVAINLVAARIILALDANFLEASLTASQRRYQWIERAKRGGGMPTIGARSRPKLGLPMPPRLAGAGPIAWRQTLNLFRGSGRLLFLLPAMIGPIIGMVATGRNPTAQQGLVGGMGVGVVFFLGFMVTTLMPLGIRGDMQHTDTLKSLPVRGSAIAWGSTLSAALYTLCIQILAVAAMAIAGGGFNKFVALALVFAVPVDLLLVASDGALVMLFPSAARMVPGDPMTGVRMMLVYLAKMLFFAVMGGIVALAVFLVYLATGDERSLMFATAWIIATIEGLATVWVMGRLFEQLDPSAADAG